MDGVPVKNSVMYVFISFSGAFFLFSFITAMFANIVRATSKVALRASFKPVAAAPVRFMADKPHQVAQ